MPETTVVDLIRHGEPVGGRRFRGQRDDPLSELGWRQMREAVAGEPPWQAIVSSPLCRCRDFAAEVAGARALPLTIEPRFKEIGMGSWEGRTHAELEAEQPGAVRRFRQCPLDHPPSGAEPLAAFRDRVIAGWEDVLARHAGRHVLLVGHAGVIRMIVREVLGAPLEHTFRIQVANASITRIEVLGRGAGAFPRLLFHGGTP